MTDSDVLQSMTKSLKGVLVRWAMNGLAMLGLGLSMTLGTWGVASVISAKPVLAASCDSPVGSLGGWVWVPPQ